MCFVLKLLNESKAFIKCSVLTNEQSRKFNYLFANSQAGREPRVFQKMFEKHFAAEAVFTQVLRNV